MRRSIASPDGNDALAGADEPGVPAGALRDWMFQALLANLDGMVYRCRDDADWTMEFVSEGCTRLTGYSPEDLLLNGRVSYEELTHPDDRQRVRETIDAALEKGRRFQVEYRILHADGHVRWVWEHGVGVRDQSGRIKAIEGIVEDISARVEAEQALREAERRYRSLFDNAIEGIFRTTPDGRYLDANPALARIYGFATPQELVVSLRDIKSQLYVDSGRREEFMRIVKARGEISGFESRVYRKNGDTIWISENARAVFDDEGRVLHYEGTVEDITERRLSQARIEQQANYDSLTGLANRSLLNDRLQQAIYTAASYGARLAVVFVDLDRFKFVNDTLGHDVGDRLLQVMAERLTAATAETDTVARLGGDEFVLLLHGHAGQDTVATVLERLLPTIAAPLRYGQSDLEVTCSIGVALYPDDGSDPATLLKHADSAMYRAKEQGRNNFQFFTEELNRAIKERFDLESQLRRALERGQFELHYQPRVELTTRRIIGAEALIRWHVPGRGMVSPATFIPVAEEIGLIGQISEWVLEAACTQNKRWLDAGLPCAVSVNISPQQFRGDSLGPLIARVLHETRLDPGSLEIEITESTVMHAGERMVEMLHAIKKLGVHIAVDDFGTGYSSLSYLKRFPVDRLKIDRSFVQHIADADDAVIVRAIIALGHNLGLKVLAEGVETEEQLAFLRANDCDELQGFYISKPVSAWQMTKLLSKQ
ncbi:MAG TPA: EAL domain-containing protein [Gammaproteobacteria bacterium]|nr:EAL domain-containing protein [Gammaproteobacteria bacterium]